MKLFLIIFLLLSIVQEQKCIASELQQSNSNNTELKCIIASSSLKTLPNRETLFLQRFPEGAVILFQNSYIYTIGPYASWAKARADLPAVREYYNDAFVAKCTQILAAKS